MMYWETARRLAAKSIGTDLMELVTRRLRLIQRKMVYAN